MTRHPFRFGVLSLGRSSPTAWRSLAREVEQLGYSVLHVPQHCSLRVPPPMLALAMAAEATTTLRLGTLVLANEQQHPAIVASEASWLSELSGGRFELGIGAGWMAADETALGRTFAPAAERVERLEEAVQIIKRHWSTDCFDFDGHHYQVHGLANGPTARVVRPPLLVGGGGRRVLRIAGNHADIVSIVPDMRSGRIGSASARTGTTEATRSRVAHLRRVAGSRFEDLELHTVVTGVFGADDPKAARAARAYGVEVTELANVPNVFIGDSSQMVGQVLTLREEFGITFVTVPEDAMRTFAPTVARLAGSAG